MTEDLHLQKLDLGAAKRFSPTLKSPEVPVQPQLTTAKSHSNEPSQWL